MGKHHKRRARSQSTPGGNNKAAAAIVSGLGCPFFYGQRVFEATTGFFVGVVIKIEWDVVVKRFFATTDTNVWYYHTDIDGAAITLGQRSEGVGLYGPASLEAYLYYDTGAVEEMCDAVPRPGIVSLKEAFPDYEGSRNNHTRLDVDEEAFKAHQDFLAHGGGEGYFGGC